MDKIYFTYRKRTDRNGNFYTPSYEWGNSYPELNGVATIIDEQIETSHWKKLGWIEFNEALLPKIGLEDEIKNFWKYGGLIYITNDDVVTYMQTLTNYAEVTPRKFELSPAWTDEQWNAIEAVYLEII